MHFPSHRPETSAASLSPALVPVSTGRDGGLAVGSASETTHPSLRVVSDFSIGALDDIEWTCRRKGERRGEWPEMTPGKDVESADSSDSAHELPLYIVWRMV